MEEASRQEVANAITGLDLGVLAAYFAVVIVIGVWVSRRTESGDDLFLAGRALGWSAIGFSLFASNISSTTLIGLTGAAYSTGIAASAYEWMAGVPLILLAFVFAPLYFRSKITTIPEYLERRYDRRTRLYFSAITIVLTIIVDTAGGLYAGAVVVKTFFPDIPIWVTVLAIGVFAGLYTAGGGLKAVVYTDVLQAVVLIVGSLAMTLILFGDLGWSWQNVIDNVPDPNQLSLVQPLDDEILPWPGLFLGVPILGFWYWVTNQYIVQRVLGAESLKAAQQGAMLGGFLKLLPMFIMVLPGAMAISIVPDLPNPDMVFPTLTSTVLPAGLTGLVLAGLVAAIMSSVDSTLNSSSTLVVHDFMRVDEREVEPHRVRSLGRWTTLILMAIAIVWAPFIANFGGLWDYLQQAFSILVPPVVAIFLLGALWRGATPAAAFTALIVGHVVGLALFVLTQMEIWPLHFTINVGVMVAVSVMVIVAVSAFTEKRSGEDLEDTVWHPGFAVEEGAKAHAQKASWFADVRTLACVLVVAMLAILLGFW
ncbi:sodium:solute symporter [Oceaniglobus roseus]|uniref:sodium:solute symporter n=1 Tax=Oceaniglobus roseus TaxID=1737570 RepID=UPI000C7EAA38|nr:sodium:solute symporter [Kandeliimicrobium roseum]